MFGFNKDSKMNEDLNIQEQDNERLKLRIEYWHKRLEQTLQHLQAATKLIYLVDGAVLGFCYFWIKTLGVSRTSIGTACLPVLLLAVMNYLHAGFIGNQASWYTGIDTKLRRLLDQSPVEHQRAWLTFLIPKSSHKTYQAIHLAIFFVLLIAGVLMLLYGLGNFTDISPPSAKS